MQCLFLMIFLYKIQKLNCLGLFVNSVNTNLKSKLSFNIQMRYMFSQSFFLLWFLYFFTLILIPSNETNASGG